MPGQKFLVEGAIISDKNTCVKMDKIQGNYDARNAVQVVPIDLMVFH